MIKENLGAFKEHKFFSLLEQFGNEQKENEKERQKQKGKDDKAKPKQKNDQQKEAAQAAKDAMDVVKKVVDNFNRFKSFAGSQIEEYKSFWSMQKSACGRFTKSGLCYALFNDGSSDKYKPLYVVSIESVDGRPCLCVFKTTLEEGDENPVFATRNSQAEKEFKNFLGDMKKTLKDVKQKYVETVEAKKKEEENKKKKERLDKFLKESSGPSRSVLADNLVKILNKSFFRYQPGSPTVKILKGGGYVDVDRNVLDANEMIQWAKEILLDPELSSEVQMSNEEKRELLNSIEKGELSHTSWKMMMKFLKESSGPNGKLWPTDRMAIEQGFDRDKIIELSRYAASLDQTGEGDVDVELWFQKAESLFGYDKALELAHIYGVEILKESSGSNDKSEESEEIKEIWGILSYIKGLIDQEKDKDGDEDYDYDEDYDEESLEVQIDMLWEKIGYDHPLYDMFEDLSHYKLSYKWLKQFKNKYRSLLY